MLITKGTIIMLLFSTITLYSCKKIIEIDPVTEVDDVVMFSDDAAATSATLGQYPKSMGAASLLNGYNSKYTALYGDEIKGLKNNAIDNAFSTNQLKASNTIIKELWNAGYSQIHFANRVLENLSKSKNITKQTKDQLRGETLFLRSLFYFNLVNLFGDVPLVLDTDPNLTAGLGRTPQSQIYARIITDLKEAQTLLLATYPKSYEPPADRIRPNKGAATALLARVYLFAGDYMNAAIESDKVLEMGLYSLEKDLDNVFLTKSKETIFAFMPTNPKYNTMEGRFFGGNSLPPPFILTNELYGSFEQQDLRTKKWIKTVETNTAVYRIPYKYKVYESEQVIEYDVILRLADIYLIRAEAYAALGNGVEAIASLNMIRKRAGLDPLGNNSNGPPLMAAIEVEDRHEFFVEVGHRWFNLRRWRSINPLTPKLTRADDILSIIKSAFWEPFKIYFPIPRDELLKSVKLTQNEGY